MNYLKQQYDETKKKMMLILNKQRYLCITADVWSSRAQAYLGMTVHYINDDFIQKSFVLSFRRMEKRQTNQILTAEIVKVLNDFGISVDKITHIVTDGGSAFCKAFKVYGRCADQLVEYNDPSNQDEDGIAPFIRNDDGEHFYSNILHIGENNDDLEENDQNLSGTSDIQSESQQSDDDDFFMSEGLLNEHENAQVPTASNAILPGQRRCVSHLLNLVPNYFEKELSGRAKTALISVLGKLQTIWVFPRRSSYAKKIAKDVFGCVLTFPCETRWNSQFDSMKHAYALRHKMNEYIDCLKANIKSASNLSMLTNDDWSVVAAYLKVMEPIAMSLDKLQGEENVNQGYILPTMKTMRHKINLVDGGTISKNFKEVLLRVIDRRFERYFKINENSRELVIAAVCTPRFKTNFIEHEADIELARKMLITECVRHKNALETDTTQDTAVSNDDDFYLSFSSGRLFRRSSVELTIEGEVDRFLNDGRRDIKILNEYPSIRDVYFEFNTTLASSGAVERLFSQCLLIFTPRRNRISDAHFEYAVFLKCNMWILNKN